MATKIGKIENNSRIINAGRINIRYGLFKINAFISVFLSIFYGLHKLIMALYLSTRK